MDLRPNGLSSRASQRPPAGEKRTLLSRPVAGGTRKGTPKENGPTPGLETVVGFHLRSTAQDTRHIATFAPVSTHEVCGLPSASPAARAPKSPPRRRRPPSRLARTDVHETLRPPRSTGTPPPSLARVWAHEEQCEHRWDQVEALLARRLCACWERVEQGIPFWNCLEENQKGYIVSKKVWKP